MPRFTVFKKPLESLEDIGANARGGTTAAAHIHAVVPSKRKSSYTKLMQQKQRQRQRQHHNHHHRTFLKFGAATAQDLKRQSTAASRTNWPSSSGLIQSFQIKSRNCEVTTGNTGSTDKTKTRLTDASTVTSSCSSNEELLEQFANIKIDTLKIISSTDIQSKNSSDDNSSNSNKSEDRNDVDAGMINIISSNNPDRLKPAVKSTSTKTPFGDTTDAVDYPVWTMNSFKSWDSDSNRVFHADTKSVFDGLSSDETDTFKDSGFFPSKKGRIETNQYGTKHSSLFDNLTLDDESKNKDQDGTYYSSLFEGIIDDKFERLNVERQALEDDDVLLFDDGRREHTIMSKEEPLSTKPEKALHYSSSLSSEGSEESKDDSEEVSYKYADPLDEVIQAFQCSKHRRSTDSNNDLDDSISTQRSMNIREVSVVTVTNVEEIEKDHSSREDSNSNMDNGRPNPSAPEFVPHLTLPVKDKKFFAVEINESNDRLNSVLERTDGKYETLSKPSEVLSDDVTGDLREDLIISVDAEDCGSDAVIVQKNDLAREVVSSEIRGNDDRRDEVEEDGGFDDGLNRPPATSDKTSILTSRQFPQQQTLHWHAVTSTRKKVSMSDARTFPDNIPPVVRLRYCKNASFGATTMLV